MSYGQTFWFGFCAGGVVIGTFVSILFWAKFHKLADRLTKMEKWNKRIGFPST